MRGLVLGAGLATIVVLALAGSVAYAQSGAGGTNPQPPREIRPPRAPQCVNAPCSSPGWQGSRDDYPREAFDRSISATVVVRCTLTATRALENCAAERETPPGMGFGALAVKLVQRDWLMEPKRVTGRERGGQITFDYTITGRAAGRARIISDVTWAETPSEAELRAATPARSTGGSAVLRCRVEASGALADCVVAGQVPARSSFGKAALPLASRYRVDIPPSQQASYAHGDVLVSLIFPPTAD